MPTNLSTSESNAIRAALNRGEHTVVVQLAVDGFKNSGARGLWDVNIVLTNGNTNILYFFAEKEQPVECLIAMLEVAFEPNHWNQLQPADKGASEEVFLETAQTFLMSRDIGGNPGTSKHEVFKKIIGRIFSIFFSKNVGGAVNALANLQVNQSVFEPLRSLAALAESHCMNKDDQAALELCLGNLPASVAGHRL